MMFSVHIAMAVGICVAQRVVLDVAVQVERLRIWKACVRNWGGTLAPVGGHEAAEIGGVVAGAEVVEAGFGVAFFAGEMKSVPVRATRQGVAEGKTGAGFAHMPAVIKHIVHEQAFRAQPVGVIKDCITSLFAEMAAARINLILAAGATGKVVLDEGVAREVVDVIALARAVASVAGVTGAMNSSSFGVVQIRGGGAAVDGD